MNNWNFASKNQELFEELKNLDSSVENVLNEVFEEINHSNSTLLKFWIEAGLKYKVDTYLLRYIIPMYELLNQEKRNQKIIIDSLIVQLLSCVSWRTFDNCIDTHELLPTAQQTSLITCMHLYDFSKSCSTETILPALESHFKIMTNQVIIEKLEPISIDDIWKRCSIFLFAAENIAALPDAKIEIFKMYINYTGLAHDTHDYFSDISNHVISLPVFWMKQINIDEVLSISTVKFLYDKVRTEIKPLEAEFESLEIESKYPLIHHLLKESWRTFHDE